MTQPIDMGSTQLQLIMKVNQNIPRDLDKSKSGRYAVISPQIFLGKCHN